MLFGTQSELASPTSAYVAYVELGQDGMPGQLARSVLATIYIWLNFPKMTSRKNVGLHMVRCTRDFQSPRVFFFFNFHPSTGFSARSVIRFFPDCLEFFGGRRFVHRVDFHGCGSYSFHAFSGP